MATPQNQSNERLTQPPLNASFMGVAMGVAEHFGKPISMAECFVESGFAFAINIHPDICPSGPYCWNHEPLLDGLRRMGIDGAQLQSSESFGTKEEKIDLISQIRSGFDTGVVSLIGLDHQIVVYCDTEKMKFAMPWGSEPWSCISELAYEDWFEQDEPPPFGFYHFKPCKGMPNHHRTRLAVKNALAMYQTPSAFQVEDYQFGPNAYNQWIDALQNDKGDQHGQWWNCTVWSECRYFAAEYFRTLETDTPAPTKDLAGLFRQSFSLLREASRHATDNPTKAELIKQVRDCESQVPPLLAELDQCVLSGIQSI